MSKLKTQVEAPIGAGNEAVFILRTAESFEPGAFNQSIEAWDVSNVTDMHGMFNGSKYVH